MSGFNAHPHDTKWTGGDQDGTPDGPKLHSILIDSRDAKHLHIGSVFESCDRGAQWQPLNADCRADFYPDPYPEFGHDPHCVSMPLEPDILYQQNHCGIYRLDRRIGKWDRVGEHMPKAIGDIGFPMLLHPRDADRAWVIPMDGTAVWSRTSPGGKPACYVTRNAGRS